MDEIEPNPSQLGVLTIVGKYLEEGYRFEQSMTTINNPNVLELLINNDHDYRKVETGFLVKSSTKTTTVTRTDVYIWFLIREYKMHRSNKYDLIECFKLLIQKGFSPSINYERLLDSIYEIEPFRQIIQIKDLYHC